MAIKVPRTATILFKTAERDALLEGGELCLYQNNFTPIDTMVIGDLTEADFDGYARIPLTGWSAPALNGDFKAQTDLPAQIFTMTGSTTPNDIYGVFVVDGSGNLLYAELDPSGPVTMDTDGQFYGYVPRFTNESEF